MEQKEWRLSVFIASALDLTSLSQGVSSYCDEGGRVKVCARTRQQFFDEAQKASFLRSCLRSDAVILSLHGGTVSFPLFDELMEALAALPFEKRPYLHIQPTAGDEDSMLAAERDCPTFGTELWDTCHTYMLRGGRFNYHQFLRTIYNHLFQQNLPVEPPLKQRNEGIYHPDMPHDISFEEYLEKRVHPGRLTVGIWFYQTYWLNDNLAFIDALIRAVEAEGANVIPVFHLRFKESNRGNHGADYVVDHFFMEEGRPRIDALLNPMLFSLNLASPDYRGLLERLGVPFLQAMVSMGTRAQWEESEQGMRTMDVSFNAAQPEFDGALISVPVATREEQKIDPITGGLLCCYQALGDRPRKLARLALNWARLRRLKNEERRVAIIFHHYPPRDDRIGCAAGLDSFASVSDLVSRLKSEGYQVEREYEDGTEMAHELLERVTADRRWLTPEKLAERAEALAGRESFTPWHEELPEWNRKKMTADWGEMPGEMFVHNDTLYFPGMVNGNLFITIQPPRGNFDRLEKDYHDMHLSPPHHYLAFYRWIRDEFKADAVIHVGKHGSLEWMPGKALGLSEKCWPDLAIMELPNIYPYIINDPSEGTQAKRRSYACIIDHLTPVFTNADLYEELAVLSRRLEEYSMASAEDPAKKDILKPLIWEAVIAAHLEEDLGMTEAAAMSDFEGFLERMHSYLHELSDTMIGDGLHTLGRPPQDEGLVEFLTQLTRNDNGNVPSLRESVVTAMGFDYDDLLLHRGASLPAYGGKTGGQCLSAAHDCCLQLVRELAAKHFQGAAVKEIVADSFPARAEGVVEALTYVADFLSVRVAATTEEMDSTLAALEGKYVLPGPSGAPSRGQADILPTGRNFYSVDPHKIPTPAAWEMGKQLGDALIARWQEEQEGWPDSVGILVYGGGTMRTRGDDIAEIYYLMGVKPVWQKSSGNVVDLEVIPREELGRPRLDVMPRVSGFFRDAFPNLMERIDEAVAIVSALREPLESNILRRNVLADMEELRQQGMSREEAEREATFRVFSCPPGSYGAGVSELVESKQWETQDELGEAYIRYSSHAYGKGSYGDQKPATFRRLLSRMEMTVKNEDSREYDMMSCTDYYNYYGGLIVAGKTVRGELPLAIEGDSSDPKRVRMRSTFEEAKHILRSRLVNPKWLEGMKRHGYKGAGDISHMMDTMFGWDATAEVMDDWMYEAVAKKYALDPEMQEWMKDVNPHALHNILDKLLEAIGRGMWDADREMEEQLRDEYLEMEGEIEERTE